MMAEFQRLLVATIEGKAIETENGKTWLDEVSPDVLGNERTRKRNTCLHIASLCGHKELCAKILRQESHVPSVPSLLSDTNMDGETPLLIAVKSGHVDLAEDLLKEYIRRGLNQEIMTRDNHGRNNVLHYAIRNGHDKLALELIQKQPALSTSCNERKESPIFMAVQKKDFKKVCLELLTVLSNESENLEDTKAFDGAFGNNALHAAIKYDNQEFVQELVRRCPGDARRLARAPNDKNETPMHLAAHFNRVEILKVMLQFDQSLGYIVEPDGIPLLYTAAGRGHVEFARALLEHCPDAPYLSYRGRTCLHEAVLRDRLRFVEFILEKDSNLGKLVNMLDGVGMAVKKCDRDCALHKAGQECDGDCALRMAVKECDGDSALHMAVKECNPKMVNALLNHPGIDITVINKHACTAIWGLNDNESLSKTINWNKIFLDIYDKDRGAEGDLSNLHEEVENKIKRASREDAKSLIQTYTGNTSLVAILIATITFAAAFTLPGGYSSQAGSEGLPIMTRKLAFQAFLIFDTLAMFSSLAVAFICVIVRWKDFEFLLHYRFLTKKLMWFAYMATTLAFATGLYTVLADRLHWLGIAICVLSALLPILTMLIGEWPILKLKIRYHDTPFKSNFLDMV